MGPFKKRSLSACYYFAQSVVLPASQQGIGQLSGIGQQVAEASTLQQASLPDWEKPKAMPEMSRTAALSASILFFMLLKLKSLSGKKGLLGRGEPHCRTFLFRTTTPQRFDFQIFIKNRRAVVSSCEKMSRSVANT